MRLERRRPAFFSIPDLIAIVTGLRIARWRPVRKVLQSKYFSVFFNYSARTANIGIKNLPRNALCRTSLAVRQQELLPNLSGNLSQMLDSSGCALRCDAAHCRSTVAPMQIIPGCQYQRRVHGPKHSAGMEYGSAARIGPAGSISNE